MSKLGWHFQKTPKEILTLMQRSKASWVKFVDPPTDNIAPGKLAIGRHYIPDGQANELIMRGVAGADEWFDIMKPAFDRCPWIDAWELPNEPLVRTPEQRAALATFSPRAIYRMHDIGKKTVAFNFSSGTPEIEDVHEFEEVFSVTDYWSMHCYGRWVEQYRSWHDRIYHTEYYSLRYRAVVRALQQPVPPLLITECGLELGGWKKFESRSEFIEQLVWFSNELDRDLYVAAATIFTSGPYSQWVKFDFDEALSYWLYDYLEMLPPSVPPVPPEDIEAAVREGTWNLWEIPYNPEAAFQKKANELKLGAPATTEYTVGAYTAQAYMLGILYCKTGHWDDIKCIDWTTNP